MFRLPFFSFVGILSTLSDTLKEHPLYAKHCANPENKIEIVCLWLRAPKLWLPDADSWFIRKDPDARKDWGGEGDDRGRDDWMASLTQEPGVWASSGRWVKDREAWCAAAHGVTQSRTCLRDWRTAATMAKSKSKARSADTEAALLFREHTRAHSFEIKGDNISLKISLIFNSVKGIRICIQMYIKINYIQNNIFPHPVICCEKHSMETWEGITKDLKLAYSQ